MQRTYFDHNATTRLDPSVLNVMLPFLADNYGNPSSIHWFGRDARRALDTARRHTADLIGAEPEEIVFTSGGTESDNQAILGIACLLRDRGDRIITTAIEHQAVLNSCLHLQQMGFRITFLPVDSEGRIDPSDLEHALDKDVILVSIMHANNETGTVQPLREAASIARARGVLFHTDAVQAAGRIPIDVNKLGVDLLSLSGHKIHGPKGSGALFVRRGIQPPVLIHGGHHEHGRRAGTENVPAIAGLGEACRLAKERLPETARVTGMLRERLEKGILGQINPALVNGSLESRLPNTLNVSFPGLDGQFLAINLDLMGIAVSTGSACHAESREPSYVLKAMGRSDEEASCCIRFSLGHENTVDEVDRVVAALNQVIKDLRAV